MTSLKGAIALFIAAYHYYGWGIAHPDDWAINMAQFGVVLFFTMSGYGLSQGYRGDVDWRRFWLRRVRRVVPWFWVATLAMVAIAGWPGWTQLLLNLSLTWPLVDRHLNLATGAWAVSAEVAFYIAFWAWGRWLGFVAWIGWLAIGLSVAYGWAVLSPDVLLVVQFDQWVHPITQAAAFFAGALLVPRLPPSWLWPVLWVALCLAVPTPWAVSWLRPLLIVAGCGVVATVTKLRSPADFLGRYSYQIYLLHPVIWFAVV